MDVTLGGEMELPLAELVGQAEPPPGFVAVDSGRSALRLVARLLPRDRPVLLPDYLCESVARPFAREGLAVELYPVGERLAADPELVRRRLEETRASTVVVIDYFGFPLGRELAAALPEDVRVIEDRSHGSLLEWGPPPPADRRTFRVTSLRKYLPLADGALCDGEGLRQPPPGPGRAAALRTLAKALRHEFVADGAPAALEAAYLALFEQAESELDRVEPEAMSAASAALLARLDLRAAAARRRRNYGFLLAALRGDDRLAEVAAPLLGDLPDGVSPLALPVRVRGDRDRLRAELAARRAFCPVHWPLPDGGARASVDARELSARILSLPVDQRYGEAEMALLVERLAAVAEAAR